MRKQIPNIFTLFNLFFGCLAIVYTLQNGIEIHDTDQGAQYVQLTEKLFAASLCIAIAALIDFFDGFVARLLGASSEMGKQLDSLADVVSFGAAPSLILFQFLRMAHIKESGGLEVSLIFLTPAFFFAMAGAYRLARFNISAAQTYGFIGVPIPAAGLVVAALPLIYWSGPTEFVANLLLNKWFLYAFTFLLSWLMVSTLPLLALKFKDYSFAHNKPKYFLLAIAVVAAVLLKWFAIPVVFVAYIILSLLFKQKN